MALDLEYAKENDVDDLVKETLKTKTAYNILVVTQNDADLVYIKKLLDKPSLYKIYEAGNLKNAFKVTKHIELDLIIADDMLPTAKGFEVIDRFNAKRYLKEIPKILLITHTIQKEKYDAIYDESNLDFIKKPIDPILFQARIKTLFKNMRRTYNEQSSVFEEMIDTKMQEAKSFLTIYKSFLNIDENILFIYDHKQNRVVEANEVFLRFFDDLKLFNRILGNRRYLRKFVPYLEDASYLNHYESEDWIDLMVAADGFNFALQVLKEKTSYSFSMMIKKVEISNHQMYVVKMLNSHHYLPASEHNQFKQCRQKVNGYLQSLKEQIDLDDSKRSYKKIYKMIHAISAEINEQDREKIIDVDIYNHSKINVYYTVARMLKEYASFKTLYLNNEFVDQNLEENKEEIYLKIDPDALHDSLKGIIDSYFTAPVEFDKRKIFVDLYVTAHHLKVEIKAGKRKERSEKKKESVFSKLLAKDDLKFSEEKSDILPKNVQQAIGKLKAEVKHFSENEDIIFLITIPIP